jgi:hypothetical protein
LREKLLYEKKNGRDGEISWVGDRTVKHVIGLGAFLYLFLSDIRHMKRTKITPLIVKNYVETNESLK